MPPDTSELNDRLISFAWCSFLFHFHSLMGELRNGLFAVGISAQREYAVWAIRRVLILGAWENACHLRTWHTYSHVYRGWMKFALNAGEAAADINLWIRLSCEKVRQRVVRLVPPDNQKLSNGIPKYTANYGVNCLGGHKIICGTNKVISGILGPRQRHPRPQILLSFTSKQRNAQFLNVAIVIGCLLLESCAAKSQVSI